MSHELITLTDAEQVVTGLAEHVLPHYSQLELLEARDISNAQHAAAMGKNYQRLARDHSQVIQRVQQRIIEG